MITKSMLGVDQTAVPIAKAIRTSIEQFGTVDESQVTALITKLGGNVAIVEGCSPETVAIYVLTLVLTL